LARFTELYKLDPLELIEQEPDPGLGSGGLGRLAAVSSVPWGHARDEATFGKISICSMTRSDQFIPAPVTPEIEALPTPRLQIAQTNSLLLVA
jgi:hypothetical protein